MLVYYETCNILGVLHDLIQTTPYYASLDCTILITILEGLANMGIFLTSTIMGLGWSNGVVENFYWGMFCFV